MPDTGELLCCDGAVARSRLRLTSHQGASIVTHRKLMNIVKATRRYETWMGSHTPLVKRDLHLKHTKMKPCFLFCALSFTAGYRCGQKFVLI
jgi:hypothetical protein